MILEWWEGRTVHVIQCIRRVKWILERKQRIQGFWGKGQTEGDIGFTYRKGGGAIPDAVCITNGPEASKGTDMGAEWPELPDWCLKPARGDPSEVFESMRDPNRMVLRMNESSRTGWRRGSHRGGSCSLLVRGHGDGKLEGGTEKGEGRTHVRNRDLRVSTETASSSLGFLTLSSGRSSSIEGRFHWSQR